MKYQGYSGTILQVDLSQGKIESTPIAEKLAENFIGGVGIAAAVIDEGPLADLDPLDVRNALVFMTGPLTGTPVPWSGRHCVAAISPLTGVWGESYAGGTWGTELKRAGFDGIVITGRAEHPVYLKIINQSVAIEDAEDIAGRDTFETKQLLCNLCGERVKVAAIGSAGERLVKFAAIVHDGSAARTAARCGVGAVMGSKNLKAIAVLGSQSVAVREKEKLLPAIRKAVPVMIKEPEHCFKKAAAVFSMFVDDGRHGVNNWRDGYLAGFKNSVLKEIENHVREAHPYQCASCPTGCVESYVKAGLRQNVWESMAPLGSQCGITDLGLVQKAYDLCNRNGIDSISAGGVISFAMECFAQGLINEKDTDGIQLTFGNGTAMLSMLEKICVREGFGAILAEGTRRAAQMIGKGAEKYAIEVKGLEVPAHDPRAHNFLALAYATDPRGAIHTGAADPRVEGFDLMEMATIRFNGDMAPEMVARGQDYGCILNSLVLCAFSHAGYAQNYAATGFSGITAKEVVEWFNLVTGMEQDFASLMLSGERIFNLKHLINLRRGCDSSSDYLHERFTTLKRNYGPAVNHLPPVDKMIKDYYRVRGWEADSRIQTRKLAALGLEELRHDA
jgi:aldehyde:ferredoxin oxidoreductase